MTGNVGDDRKLARVTVDVGGFGKQNGYHAEKAEQRIYELLE